MSTVGLTAEAFQRPIEKDREGHPALRRCINEPRLDAQFSSEFLAPQALSMSFDLKIPQLCHGTRSRVFT